MLPATLDVQLITAVDVVVLFVTAEKDMLETVSNLNEPELLTLQFPNPHDDILKKYFVPAVRLRRVILCEVTEFCTARTVPKLTVFP